MNYYNEIDPFAAQWLRNLITEGRIPDGYVDQRSIEDVTPDDLSQFAQCHFFAGIGTWSLALQRAGWPSDRPVWTGSCPCQPFSEAGKGVGFADERHLWPAFHYLIEKCRPPTVFGEQVASVDGLNWLDLVLADLEGSQYAAAAFDLSAAGFGLPHIRQRLFWVGHTELQGLEGPHRHDGAQAGRQGTHRPTTPTSLSGNTRPTAWLRFSDGKMRPVEPGVSPLAHDHPGRVGLVRAYGNAIVTDVAQGFIESVVSSLGLFDLSTQKGVTPCILRPTNEPTTSSNSTATSNLN